MPFAARSIELVADLHPASPSLGFGQASLVFAWISVAVGVMVATEVASGLAADVAGNLAGDVPGLDEVVVTESRLGPADPLVPGGV
jgi:hypothetical protein